LIIDRVTDKLLECRERLVENSSGDRLEDALTKADRDRQKRGEFFDSFKERQENKKKLAEEIFRASLEDAKKEPDKKPRSIFDAD